jgi:DNA repair protein NreA
MTYCKICGKPNCKEHTFLVGKAVNIKEFSGSSPPEIFVGKYNYPNVNIGILSPQTYGNNQLMSSPEQWHKNKLDKFQIVDLRNKLILGRTQNHIKNLQEKFLNTMQEVAMTSKSISTEFKLKKAISTHPKNDGAPRLKRRGLKQPLVFRSQRIENKHSELFLKEEFFNSLDNENNPKTPLITNAAQIEKVRLQENIKIIPKVDYITSDTDAKSITGILELNNTGLNSSQIIKILSAGLLGQKTKRKLVPTRWSITAVDDTLSKEKLKKIKYYPEISEILLFTSEYLGNHYEFILLPDKFSFEVIEIALGVNQIWKDYEGFFPRKKYAKSVTGAYYANRLALTEYLEKIKRQASCLVLREIRPEYDVPLGVGILREASRNAFKNKPKRFNTINEALNNINTRLKQPITNYTKDSTILKEFGKQKKLWDF